MDQSDDILENRRLCLCGREAVEKVAGSRGPNHGLRYRCCDRFVFFGKKRNYCSFFEWIDSPRVTQKEKQETRAVKHQKKGQVSANTLALESANIVDSAVRDSAVVKAGKLHKTHVETDLSCAEEAQHDQNASLGHGLGEQSSSEPTQDICIRTPGVSLVRALCEQDKSNAKLDTHPGECEDVSPYSVQDRGLTGTQDITPVQEILETPNCECSRAALLKTVKSKGPNQGFRYWVCSNSKPFYMKKGNGIPKNSEESCKFFRWIDTPSEEWFTQKAEQKTRRKENRRRKELAILS